MTYTWDIAVVGDAAPPVSAVVTDVQIADYCRAARYENLVYTNQPAAQETGLPGIVAPPAMALAYAPPQLSALAAARDCALPDGIPPHPAAIAIRFHGVLVTPGDAITAQTALSAKRETDGNRYLTFTVTAHNQRGESVADYDLDYLWEGQG